MLPVAMTAQRDVWWPESPLAQNTIPDGSVSKKKFFGIAANGPGDVPGHGADSIFEFPSTRRAQIGVPRCPCGARSGRRAAVSAAAVRPGSGCGGAQPVTGNLCGLFPHKSGRNKKHANVLACTRLPWHGGG